MKAVYQPGSTVLVAVVQLRQGQYVSRYSGKPAEWFLEKYENSVLIPLEEAVAQAESYREKPGIY